MELSRVQAVLLDMDGTLVDSDAAVERSWRTWAVEYPVDPGRGPLVAHGLPAVSNVRRLRPDLSEDEAVAAAQRQLELEYADVGDVAATPGAHELLAELDRLGLPWAVVSCSGDQRRTAKSKCGYPVTPRPWPAPSDRDRRRACMRLPFSCGRTYGGASSPMGAVNLPTRVAWYVSR